MRIAIFSDIHGNLNGLNAVLEDIERRGGADAIVAAGDLVTDGPRPNQTFDRMVETGCLMLRGNHDEYLLGRGREMIQPEKQEDIWRQTLWVREQFGPERLALLEQQPFERVFSPDPAVQGHDLVVVHASLQSVYGFTGIPEQTEEILQELYGSAPTSVEIVAFGHWHFASVRTWRGLKLVNVASISYPKDRARLAGYTFFSWDKQARCWQIEQNRVPFDWREEARLLRECDMPGPAWHVERYYFEPEEEVMASVA